MTRDDRQLRRLLKRADLLTVGMIGDRVGLGADTVRVMSARGQLPEPDLILNVQYPRPTKLWFAITIEHWDAKRSKR